MNGIHAKCLFTKLNSHLLLDALRTENSGVTFNVTVRFMVSRHIIKGTLLPCTSSSSCSSMKVTLATTISITSLAKPNFHFVLDNPVHCSLPSTFTSCDTETVPDRKNFVNRCTDGHTDGQRPGLIRSTQSS